MSVTITEHAAKRMKERLGIPKKAHQRQAERAVDRGLKPSESKGDAKKLMDSRLFQYRKASNMKLYNGFVYVFHEDALLTVFELPKLKLKKGD